MPGHLPCGHWTAIFSPLILTLANWTRSDGEFGQERMGQTQVTSSYGCQEVRLTRASAQDYKGSNKSYKEQSSNQLYDSTRQDITLFA